MKLIIAGIRYQVRRNPKRDGGYFDTEKHIIEIGTASKDKQRIGEVLLHEVLECLMTERMLRFQRPYTSLCNGDYLFVMNHVQYEQLVKDLNILLEKIYV